MTEQQTQTVICQDSSVFSEQGDRLAKKTLETPTGQITIQLIEEESFDYHEVCEVGKPGVIGQIYYNPEGRYWAEYYYFEVFQLEESLSDPEDVFPASIEFPTLESAALAIAAGYAEKKAADPQKK